MRFTAETLDVRYLDVNIAEVPGARVEQALPRFEAHPRIHRALALPHDVGLGYLTLADTILNRLVHNACKLQLKGGSMRKQHAVSIHPDHCTA